MSDYYFNSLYRPRDPRTMRHRVIIIIIQYYTKIPNERKREEPNAARCEAQLRGRAIPTGPPPLHAPIVPLHCSSQTLSLGSLLLTLPIDLTSRALFVPNQVSGVSSIPCLILILNESFTSNIPYAKAVVQSTPTRRNQEKKIRSRTRACFCLPKE